MSIESIIALINKEIEQLKQARALLATSGQVSTKLTTAKTTAATPGKKRGPKPGKKRRALSPEARQRIADAQHRRWAKLKSKVDKPKNK